MTVTEYIDLLKSEKNDSVVVQKCFFEHIPMHISKEEIEYVEIQISEKFNVPRDSVKIIVTGSASLGFSIYQKSIQEPIFRKFSNKSDFDLAIISKPLYEKIWDDLSRYSTRKMRFPWDSNLLGDYKLCGWIRPDHLPNDTPNDLKQRWFSLFDKITRVKFKNTHKVTCGLFYDETLLVNYVTRSIRHSREYI